MWLQHFTDKALPGLTLLGLALAASGCASSGPRADGAESGRTEHGAAEVPPEALTMYEQAVAVMASGDFLDAELRFKEFVLRYPGYPGAYVNLAIIHVNDDNDEDARAAVNAALALLAHYNLGVLNELYLQRLDSALQHFERYQEIVGGDEQVEKWITDLQRRVAASQRTANTAE
jgi:Flp pilus assembly protein TadD